MAENQKIKVADLPKDEQDKLLNEAREYDIKGLVQTWNVETLQKKIADAKAAKENAAPAADEQTPGADEQNGENSEQNTAENEQTAENVNATRANDEQSPATDETKNEETPAAPKVDKGNGRAYAKDVEPTPAKVKICHICRSKVVNGKCTGCGFELRK